MKSHAFVRENAPNAILYGKIYSQQIKVEDVEDKVNDSPKEETNGIIPHTPCPEF
ncbi:unnamed protein product, partial [Rotaria magnacalcarata]